METITQFNGTVEELAQRVAAILFEKVEAILPKPEKDEREWVKAGEAIRLAGFQSTQALVYHRLEDGAEIKGKIRYRTGKKHYTYHREDCENFRKNKHNNL